MNDASKQHKNETQHNKTESDNHKNKFSYTKKNIVWGKAEERKQQQKVE